jgi:hypothetical protein
MDLKKSAAETLGVNSLTRRENDDDCARILAKVEF